MTSPSNNKADSFKEVQHVFTQHMRDPDNNSVPEGIEQRRIAIYTDLIYRNIQGFIANSFPVLRKITADDDWELMIRDYVNRHVSHTPYFPKMPLEFLHYLEKERNNDNEPGFYFELAHYEWIEVSIMLDQRDISFAGINQEGDLLEAAPQLSPLAMLLAYQWPVHKISPEFIPEEKSDIPTYLIVYRDRNYDMGFIELNPVSAKLIEELTNNIDKPGREILKSIAAQLQHPEPDTVINGGLEILQDFKAKDIVLGTK